MQAGCRGFESHRLHREPRKKHEMPKVTWLEGVPHRLRRGELVAIPAEWFGHTVTHQKIKRRYSKNRIKKIESKQIRAREKAAMGRDEEPLPGLRKTRTHWYCASGRTDAYRDKFRRDRRASHPREDA